MTLAPRDTLLDIFQHALQVVNGRTVVRNRLQAEQVSAPVYLVAVGKAACAMAQGAHDALGDCIIDVLIVTKHGYAEVLPWPVLEAGHPLPDARSLAAGEKLLQFVESIPKDARVLVLLSGGASALLEALPQGVTLDQLRAVTDWLLAGGFDIHAMNLLRKRLSRIKGGRLASLLAPRRVLCLAISDVSGDDPRAIGSGPLSADERLQLPPPATYPEFILELLRKAPPAPQTDDACFQEVQFEIVASLGEACRAATERAAALGFAVQRHDEFLDGDAAVAGAHCARTLATSALNVVHVWGGETTVQLPPHPGRGGRNQALALAAALELAGQSQSFLLAAGTDGSDGPTDDAGALVDSETVARGAREGLDVRDCLARADSGSFLEASGDLIQTGPTGTNVMDLVLGLRA